MKDTNFGYIIFLCARWLLPDAVMLAQFVNHLNDIGAISSSGEEDAAVVQNGQRKKVRNIALTIFFILFIFF